MQEKKIVCALLVNDSNHILLQDRKGISKYGEEWSFFGGGIEDGESPEDALIRELQEELNWKPAKYSFIGETKHTITDRSLLYHRYIYLVRGIEGKVWIDHEGSGAHFFPISEIKKLKFNTSIEGELSLLYDNI